MVMIIMMGRIIIINLVLNYFDIGYLDYEFEYIFLIFLVNINLINMVNFLYII